MGFNQTTIKNFYFFEYNMSESKIFIKSMDYSEIVEKFLYIGSHQSSNNLDGLKSLKITHVVVLAGKCQFPSEFAYGIFHFKDGSVEEEIIEKISKICEFIESARQNASNRVFVHCRAGLSRSPFIAAYELVHRSRSQIRMHQNFCKALIQMDKTNSCSLEKILNQI
ncbi:dual specificity phosphatase 1-like [Brachionus plicatilis]|uniref:protein-tyrosine-phosphatase n=1 Tax=Brachionus plicatilis TaxID=10195 RepID=A0A3M7Q6I2_BRAPC|nr:dual specificity phosphatase 1-like [Brachionus plicatilis]